MALKEHPFLATTSFKHDKSTITYDITQPNRSTAVGKVYRINEAGVAELPPDGEAFDGVITAVDDTQITGAYLFAGLRVPLASNATVKRGDKLVAGLGPSSAKGYVKAASVATALDAVETADIDTEAEKVVAHNAARTEITNLINAAKGKGSVINFDATHALMAFPG